MVTDTKPTKTDLTVGDVVRLGDIGSKYRVRAVTEHFAALTRGTSRGREYTIVDWRNNRRGACNLIGWGYGTGTYDEAECAEMLAEFESGELELSHRNNVPLEEITILTPAAPEGDGGMFHRLSLRNARIELAEKIAPLYRAGSTIRQIAALTSFSYGYIRSVLIEAGVRLRPPGRGGAHGG